LLGPYIWGPDMTDGKAQSSEVPEFLDKLVYVPGKGVMTYGEMTAPDLHAHGEMFRLFAEREKLLAEIGGNIAADMRKHDATTGNELPAQVRDAYKEVLTNAGERW
jgi:hypothetical protein